MLALIFCQNAYADFNNSGDVFGRGLIIQASGVTVTGGGRTLNFLNTTVSTSNPVPNVYNITPSGSGGGGSPWNITDGINTVNSVGNLTVTGGTVGGSTPNATLTISGSGSPAGSNTQLQYNSNGSFAGSSGVITNGSSLSIGSGVNWTAIALINSGTNWPSALNVYGGGIAAEPVNKGYELIMPQPALLNVSGAQNEVQGFGQYKTNLYIGYFSNNSTPRLSKSTVFKWDGNAESLFYELDTGPSQNGFGSDFGGIKPVQEAFGKLFIGNQTGFSGGNSGAVYVYDPNATVSNMLQWPSQPGTTETSSVSIPNNSSNNAIFGATSYSAEWYGRVDDLGQNSQGVLLRKFNSAATSGYGFRLNNGNTISVAITDSGTNKTTTTSSTFLLGNNHYFFFSWTSGSAPVLYIDSSTPASLASSQVATTPSNDTSNILYFGNNVSNTEAFSGTFRLVNIWRNYALTSTDVGNLLSGGSAASNPTGSYKFKEGSGTTTADSSGNGNTGTLNGNVNWNNNLFDVSFNSGSDFFIYSMAVFKGNLYAGAGYVTSRIYQYNGTTWSTAYSGLANHGLVNDLYVHKGLLFAALSGTSGANGGAIISSPDGVTWTTEINVPYTTATGFDKMWEFKGNLYTESFKGATGTNDIYRRYISNAGVVTWQVESPSISAGQCWGINNYNNALYVGCTTSGGASIYKSYDGVNFPLDFQVPNANQTENFATYNYNGSLYLGMGFSNSTSATVYRKTDSVGQQTDWINNFINHFYGNTQNGYNWTNDNSLISEASPWIFNSNVGIGLNTGNGANSSLDLIGGVSIGTQNTSTYTTITAPSGGLISEGNVGIGTWQPGQMLDVRGTINMNGFSLPTGAASGYVLTSNSVGIGTWYPAPSGSGSGTVTSVTLATPSSTLTLGGTNPITTSGTINADINLTNPNTWSGQQTFVAPILGTPASGVATNLTGTASGLTAGTVTTNANLTGDITSSGNATTLASVNSNVGSFTSANITVNGKGLITAAANGSGGSSQWTTINTNDVYLPNSGNVGIGTSFIGGASEGALSVMNGNVGIGTWLPKGILQVGSGVTPGLVITAAGNVAIGSTTAASNLNVGPTATGFSATIAGAVNAQSYSGSAAGAFINTNATSGFEGNSNSGGSSTVFQGGASTTSLIKLRSTSANGTTDSINFLVGNNGGTTAMIVQDNSGTANVGIGSLTPGQALDVKGTIRALSSGTCNYLYLCVGGVDAGVIQTSACNLCPAGTCTQMNLCG